MKLLFAFPTKFGSIDLVRTDQNNFILVKPDGKCFTFNSLYNAVINGYSLQRTTEGSPFNLKPVEIY